MGSELEVRGAANARELEAAHVLMAKTQLPPDKHCLRWLRESGPYWPGFALEHTRVAWEDGRPVGALRILTLSLRIGRARLKTGGIGWVSTATSHRGRGICRLLMRDAHHYMGERGYALSLLFGVPGLYHKFGYTTMLPAHSIVLPAAAAVCDPKAFLPRAVTWKDVRVLRELHERHEQEAACSVERSAPYFKTLFQCTAPTIPFWPDWSRTRALIDARGGMAGYLMPQRGAGELHIKELGVRGAAECGGLVAAALATARRAGLSQVRFHVPPGHPLARHLREYDALHQAEYFHQREGMLALMNPMETLRHLLPEWKHRMQAAGCASRDLRLPLQVGEERFMLHLRRGECTVGRGAVGEAVEVSTADFCRLLSGFWSGAEFLQDRKIPVSQDIFHFFCTIFPSRAPFLWPIDHF